MQFVESATKGQPDKICDQIADAIVDEYLRRDPKARVSIEVLGGHGAMMIGGEATSTADFDLAAIAKHVYRECGYLDELEPFVNVATDAEDVLDAVKSGGANDMTVVTGYATSVAPQMLPRSLVAAHAIAKRLDDLRELDFDFSWLRPDGKIQIGSEGEKIRSVVLAIQHDESVDESFVRTRLVERVLAPMLGDLDGIRILVNRGSKMTAGGFQSSTGVTGRKIGDDTYGGLLPWTAGALSGKDPSKIDRLGSYMARFVAKRLVAGGVKSALVQVAYARGEERPLYVSARSGEGKDLREQLGAFDFRPAAILERLDLRKPRYRLTATYGHFGREGFPWEKVE